MHASDIVGYTYQADNHCPTCIKRMFGGGDLDIDADEVLDYEAERHGIDRHDESSFDSGEFPKVIFTDMAEEDEYCGTCHQSLIGDDECDGPTTRLSVIASQDADERSE